MNPCRMGRIHAFAARRCRFSILRLKRNSRDASTMRSRRVSIINSRRNRGFGSNNGPNSRDDNMIFEQYNIHSEG